MRRNSIRFPKIDETTSRETLQLILKPLIIHSVNEGFPLPLPQNYREHPKMKEVLSAIINGFSFFEISQEARENLLGWVKKTMRNPHS